MGRTADDSRSSKNRTAGPIELILGHLRWSWFSKSSPVFFWTEKRRNFRKRNQRAQLHFFITEFEKNLSARITTHGHHQRRQKKFQKKRPPSSRNARTERSTSPTRRKEEQIGEHGISLSGSYHKEYSHAYSARIGSKSSAKDLSTS